MSASFNLQNQLKQGTSIALSASAGTGKTFAIQVLALRHILEGKCKIDELLMLTFSRAAAREMRHRLLSGLTFAVKVLSDGDFDSNDSLLNYISEYAKTDGDYLQRAVSALHNIDKSMIMTFDQFWLQMCQWLDIVPDGELDTEFEKRISRLVASRFIVNNFFHDEGKIKDTKIALPISQSVFDRLIKIAKSKNDAPEVKVSSTYNNHEPFYSNFADIVYKQGVELREQLSTITYSDIIDSLIDYVEKAKDDITLNSQLKSVLARFKVVMIDEAQDTNKRQNDLILNLFSGSNMTTYYVGDPKQSIYEFRGADTQAWNSITDIADIVSSLSTNYRSDKPLVDGVNLLFSNASFAPGQTYSPVYSHHKKARISLGVDSDESIAPIEFRIMEKSIDPYSIEDLVVDIANYCSELLNRDIYIKGYPLRPSDIAILVRRNADIPKIQEALALRNIPSVSTAGSVLETEAFDQWVILLEALKPKTSTTSINRLSQSVWSVGLKGSEEERESQLWRFTKSWGHIVRVNGIGALIDAINIDTNFAASLILMSGGRRMLTDLEHIGEVISEAKLTDSDEFLQWLYRARETSDNDDKAFQRRVDLDGGAIQIMTAHKSKGLQFPVVLAPFGWTATASNSDNRLPHTFYVKQDGDYQRELILNQQRVRAQYSYLINDGSSEDRETLSDRIHQAQSHSDMRLTYVEYTRAENLLVIWYSNRHGGTGVIPALVNAAIDELQSGDCGTSLSNIQRNIIFNFQKGLTDIENISSRSNRNYESKYNLISSIENKSMYEAIGVLAACMPDLFSVKLVEDKDLQEQLTYLIKNVEELEFLDVEEPSIKIDYNWRRSSFSRWVSTLHSNTDSTSEYVDSVVDSEAIEPGEDEPEYEEEIPNNLDDAVGVEEINKTNNDIVPLSFLPAGAQVGTLLHKFFEVTDFQSETLAYDFESLLKAEVYGVLAELSDEERHVIVDGLVKVLNTPLGGPIGKMSLTDISLDQRADEMEFEFGVNTDAGYGITYEDIGSLWLESIEDDDIFSDYARFLAEHNGSRPLKGFLRGFMDLTVQTKRDDGTFMWTVMDYKTNRIAPFSPEGVSIDFYSKDSMLREMVSHDYPLQALIYQVALHRFLRANFKEYDVRKHLGGAAYLFVRGMVGEETPDDTGVFWWEAQPELISNMDRLFAGYEV